MKKIFLLIVFVICFITLIIVSLIDSNSTFYVTTVPKSYSFVSTYFEDDIMEVILYISDKRTSLTNIDNINNCYITDQGNFNSMKIELLEINDLEYNDKIKKQNYFLYSYMFKIPAIVNEEYQFSINDAILSMEAIDQNYNIKLGSFYYYKLPYYGDVDNLISVSKLLPILSKINGNDTIGAINIEISNNYNSDIEIIDFKLLENNIFISSKDIKEINEDINNNLSLSTILGYQYNIKTEIFIEREDFKKNIYNKEKINLIIPLKYLNNYSVNKLGFIIKYRNKDSNKISYLYYDDFVYFSSNNFIVNEDELNIYLYEKNRN